ANLIEEAIEVFKINVMNFKKSYNFYDSLGEAYFLVGNIDAALKNYEMSLDINPKNQNAKDMISKIKAE
ncbi:MAG TPA: peptidase S41, partial [Bacteroidales bacterium]|nr:peptidase S41 [Bacteroidales bacterium]